MNEIKLWKFNILDITVLFVLLICCILFISNRTTASNSGSASGDTVTDSSTSKFTYVFGVGSVSEKSAEMIKVGDKFYDKVTSTEIGTIKEVIIEDAVGYYTRDNGEIIIKSVPGRIDLKLVIETDGVMKDGEVYANNLIRIMAGGSKQVKTKYVMFTGEVIEFK